MNMQGLDEAEAVAAIKKEGSPTKIRPIRISEHINESRKGESDLLSPLERVTPKMAGRILKRLGLMPGGRDGKSVFYLSEPDQLEALYSRYLPDEADTNGTSSKAPNLSQTKPLPALDESKDSSGALELVPDHEED